MVDGNNSASSGGGAGDDIDDIEDLEELEGGNKGKKKLLIFLVIILVIGGVTAAYFMGFLGGGNGESVESAAVSGDAESFDGAGTDEEGFSISKDGAPIYYDLPEFLVNLQTSSGRTSFLKTTITLEVPDEETVRKISSVQPRIVDGFNTYLRELRSSDLKGSAGIYRLREEMLLRVNKAIYPNKVNNVLFKEIVVQ